MNGLATADYDNDGNVDLFIAGVNSTSFFHNNGDGTFTDVTRKRPSGYRTLRSARLLH